MMILSRKIYFIRFAICFIAFLSNDAKASEECSRNLKMDSSWLEFRHNEFLFQYTLEGLTSLKSPDFSKETVPDRVKDIALQLTTMRDMLNSLGFQHPLESKRYRSQGATHILVRFQAMERVTGRAFDEVRRLPSGECVLIMHINSNYRSGNLTPAHEYFHLVQYGYTMFKRPWFLEGTARWAETVLGRRDFHSLPPPTTNAGQRALFKESYKSALTWHGLIKLCGEAEHRVQIPEHLMALRYSTGAPVIEDDLIPGHELIKQILETLDSLDDRITTENNLREHRWPEKIQRDASHDDNMWNAVREVCP